MPLTLLVFVSIHFNIGGLVFFFNTRTKIKGGIMTPFQMFKQHFKEHESLVRYSNKGIVIQTLIRPYKIKELSKQIEEKNQKVFI